MAAGLAAVEVGQVDVQQDQVRPLSLRQPHAVAGSGGFERDEILGLELFSDRPTKVLVVIDDEEGLALSHGWKHAPC